MLIVASDIFGKIPELACIVQSITKEQTYVLSPYDDAFYNNEEVAYAAFVGAGGIEGYVEKVRQFLLLQNTPYSLLGFSAGAAAIWKALDGYKSQLITQNIGFYPGQIRHYLDIDLNTITQLIFPNSEEHFDLTHVIKSVRQYNAVSIVHSGYGHGFMNSLSSNFDQNGYSKYLKILKEVLYEDLG